MKNQKLKLISEGKTEIYSYASKQNKKGPLSKEKEPFYNSSMELNRDVSIAFVQWFTNNYKKKLQLLDGLSASGIRGIRFAKEVEGNFNVTLNDINEKSYSLMLKNMEQNKIKNIIAKNKNLNVLLSEENFDYIDIDPFGSPIYFFDSAIRSIKKNGIIAITATDVATLCGVHPKVCLRRYGAKSYHSDMMREIGLRILIGSMCKTAAMYDKGINPILSYYHDHYYRTYIQIKKGKTNANNSINNFKMIGSNEIDLTSTTNDKIGPLWMGKLQDLKVIREIRTFMDHKKFNTKKEIYKLLRYLEEEADSPPFFYNTDFLASFYKVSVPKVNDVILNLKKKGYVATITHFGFSSFKTNAPFEEIKQVFKDHYT